MKPREVLHRGVVQASGIALDEDLVGAGEARSRILAAWEPTALVHRFGNLLVLRLPRPRAVDCTTAPGLPLVEHGGTLYSAPLDEAERAAISAPGASCVVVRGGEATVLTGGEEEHPSSWIELDEFEAVEADSLGEPPPPVPSSLPDAVAVDREKLGVPAQDPESARVAAMLSRALAGEEGADHGVRGLAFAIRAAMRTTAHGIARAAAGVLGRASRLSSWFVDERQQRPIAGEEGRQTMLSAPSGQPRAPGALDKLRGAINAALARLAVLTRVSRLLGARQAEYLRSLLQSLDEGDLDRALRTAIPLGGDADESPGKVAFGVPKPRDSLQMALRAIPGSGTIGLGPSVYALLRARYRAAVERLVALGRIDEAAFVLADLLREVDEAVDFLERNGRLRLAAELAEARDLPPGRVVRQWILAGDLERALAIARQKRAFDTAVSLLEVRRPDLARVLRLHWADWLASSGDYGRAVEVAWTLPEARALAQSWLDRLLAIGGPAAARALVRHLVLAPERFADLAPRALSLLEDDAAETADERAALADEVARCKGPNPALRALARPVVRSLVRDGGAPPEVLDAVLRVARDPALQADVPRVEAKTSAPPASWRIATEDCGTLPVLDAALLPRRKLLVALGEAGARVLAPDGRTTRAFQVPVHRLVISDHGDRALAVARRGEVCRVHLLDLHAGTARDLGEATLQTFAADFDGAQWFVAERDSVVAIDLTGSGLRASWRVGRIEGVVIDLVRASSGAASLAFAVSGKATEGIEVWRYELPGLTLRSRTRTSADWKAGASQVLVSEAALLTAVEIQPDGGVCARTFTPDAQPGRQALFPLATFELGKGAVARAIFQHGFLAVPMVLADRAVVQILRCAALLLRRRFAVGLMGSREPVVRLQSIDAQPHLVVCDDRGRVLAFALDRQEKLVDVRV